MKTPVIIAVPSCWSMPKDSTRSGLNGPAKRKFTSDILNTLMPVEKPELTIMTSISA